MWRSLPTAGAALVALSAMLIAPSSAGAQCASGRFVAADAAAGDWFGRAVALSDARALIGAPYADAGGCNSGVAYVFRLEAPGVVREAKLRASDAGPYEYFGRAVAIRGDTVVIGAYGDSEHGAYAGSAYVFRFDGAGWPQVAKLRAADGAGWDYFGVAVAVCGDDALIGAPGDDDHGADSGSAYVFHFDGLAWLQVQKLGASDGAAGDSFGLSVALADGMAVIGAPRADALGWDSGAAYVFKQTEAAWVEQQKLVAGVAGDSFGLAVAISDAAVAVGAHGDDENGVDSGAAYVFRLARAGWLKEGKLLAADGAAEDAFGRHVGIEGDTVVVGAPYDDDYGAESGSAYVFRFDGQAWRQDAKLRTVGGAAGGCFGIAVAVGGDLAVIGAHLDDMAGTDSGSGSLFDLGCRCVGDLNCDGSVNAGDVPYFVLALTDPDEWGAAVGGDWGCTLLCVGDANGDGAFNAGDIPGFVDILTGPQEP